jgi:RNA polymerase sigma factor (sigma-70 family)
MKAKVLEKVAEQTTVKPHRPLKLTSALKRFRETLAFESRNGTGECRRAVNVIEDILRFEPLDSVTNFELVLNGCLDVGYRNTALVGFVYEVLRDRFAARIHRRLSTSQRYPVVADVEDLVGVTIEAVQNMIRNANREKYSITYALLLSIADHRTIDYLRRKKPELSDKIETFHAASVWTPDAAESRRPDLALITQERLNLARRLRRAVLSAVNELPSQQRAALILVEVEGRGYDDVAALLDLKRTDVGNLVRRARLQRDRNLVPRLRDIHELEGRAGFGSIQANRDLRLNLLRWTTEMGDGVCGSCVDRSFKLHSGESACFSSLDANQDMEIHVAVS